MTHKFLFFPTPFAAVLTSWWLPSLENVSKSLSEILPVAGLLLIFLQAIVAVLAIRAYFKKD